MSFSSLTSASSLAVTEAMYANALLEALHTSCDQARRAGDSLAVTEAMYHVPRKFGAIYGIRMRSPTYFVRPSAARG